MPDQSLNDVRVLVCDTGVDPDCIRQISPLLGRSYNEYCRRTREPLMPIPQMGKDMVWYYKGMKDLLVAEPGASVELFLQYLVEKLWKDIHLFSLFAHGTQVASFIE